MASRSPEHDPPSLRAPHPGDLVAVWPAAPASLSRARGTVRSWLARHRWPHDPSEDITLAADEAVTNAIVHAYRSDTADSGTVPAARVHVHAWVSIEPRTRARRVVVTVTDRGRWRPERNGATVPDDRGHGLMLINRVMDETHIQRSPAGTTVILVSPTEAVHRADDARAGF